MAFTDLGSIASGGSTGNNQASLTIATTANCAGGELVVVVVTDDNISTGGGDTLETSGVTIGTAAPFALTKGRQNSTNLAAQAGASVSLWWGVLPYAIASGQNIVATFTNAGTSDATALSARHFSFASKFNSVAVEATNAGTSTTANPGSLNATTANLACLRVRAIGCEWDGSQTLTGTASWTTWAEGASNATLTLTEQVVEVEHRISTGTGDASAPTLGSACDNASVYVAFKEVANPFRLPILDVPRGPQRGREYWIDAVGFIAAAEAETLPADAGAYALTGSDAALTLTGDSINLPAGGANWFNPWGPRRGNPYSTWFSALHIPQPVTLTAAGGSYSLTGGSAVTFAFGQAASSGSYTLTGSAAGQAFGHAAGSGAYTLTGSAAALALGHVAGAGSYSLTGSNAGQALGLGAGAGSYTITGADAGLVVPGGIAAAAGSYTLTGADAALTVSGGVDYLPAGMTGGYNPWGRSYPTSLLSRTGRPLSAAPAVLTAAAGSYTLTGADAALTVSGAVTNLPAGMTGGYVPWGQPPRQDWFWSVAYTTAPTGTTLSAGAGSYTLAGSDAALTVTELEYIFRQPLITRIWVRSRLVSVSAQNWITRSQRLGDIRLAVDAGSYALTGSAASLTVSGNFVLGADAGSYTLTGASAGQALGLTANSGAYALTGGAAPLALGFGAGAGAYAYTGADAQLRQAGTITFACEAGSYTLTGGSDVSFIGVTPPTVEQPGGGYTGGRVEYRTYRLRKKRWRDECEELLEYLEGLPPAQAQEICEQIPLERLSLLEMLPLPLPHGIVIPQGPRRPSQIEDDEDEDEIALLLEILNRS